MKSYNNTFKSKILNFSIWSNVDSFFRMWNRNKLLVIMYHGITENNYNPPIWTQLPNDVFRTQLEYLDRNYRIISLTDLVSAIRKEINLPKNSALITFDDGLINNFTVAYPVLKKMGIPATIFLTVDFISTHKLLWFDEIYLLFREAVANNKNLPLNIYNYKSKNVNMCTNDICIGYIESLKHSGKDYRSKVINRLYETIPIDNKKYFRDFGLLRWENISEMHNSGLISFGVHTATHCILSELDESKFELEINIPKKKLESFLNSEISAFCYPNGRPNIDYYMYHQVLLKKAGYNCAFSTSSEFFSLRDSNPMSIGRIPAGNDFTSNPAYFRLNTSGTIEFMKKLINWS